MGFVNKLKSMFGVEEPEEDGYYTQEIEIEEEGGRPAEPEEDKPVRNLGGMRSGGPIQMVVVNPKSFEEVGEIASNLLEKKTVVMNLEQADRENARRILDFLSGVLFTIDGQIKRVAVNNYIVTPSGVDVSSDEAADTLAGFGGDEMYF